jgi:hypothetical protein
MRAIIIALAFTCATPVLAAADVRDDVESQLHSDAFRLSRFNIDELKEFGKCRAALAKARKLKPTTRLQSGFFNVHPKAVQDGSDWVITVADIPWLCDEIDRAMVRGSLAASLADAKRYRDTLAARPELDPRARLGDGDHDRDRAKACEAAVAAERATGATSLAWNGTTYDLAEAAELCKSLAAWSEHMNRSAEANFEKVAPPYRALGIDGDRLRLFVQYANVSFRGRGCEKIDDDAVLARQKYVYQWLENADGTHTIRKYTFKGNRYTVSEKRYLTEARAYAGCK